MFPNYFFKNSCYDVTWNSLHLWHHYIHFKSDKYFWSHAILSMFDVSCLFTIFQLESQLMPTISNALLRDPSFPLIVPMAEWITPQVTKNFNYISSNGQDQTQKKPNSRPRAVSLQIPFMGGTIVPSNHVSLTKKFRIRRNSVPPQSSVNDR